MRRHRALDRRALLRVSVRQRPAGERLVQAAQPQLVQPVPARALAARLAAAQRHVAGVALALALVLPLSALPPGGHGVRGA